MPIVDDPFEFGRIASANAISDVYAMGGKPIVAIAILGWPVNVLPPSIAQKVIEGSRSICKEAGITLAGNPTLLTEMIRNLVDNAISYTPSTAQHPGVITVRVLADPFGQVVRSYQLGPAGTARQQRGNPGGLAALIMGISGHFFTERLTLGVMKTRDAELRFVTNPRLVNASGDRVPPFGGPVAILVDGMSGSASECFAGGMQSLGRARVFGQPSMGQALPALFDRLPNGDLLIHAYGDFVTSDGRRLEGRGVIPDESQPLRRDDLLAGRDRPLEAALDWIDREKKAPGGVRP